MQTVKCNNISVSQPNNHDDYCSLLFGFYDTQNQILVDNVKANDIILLNENNFKDLALSQPMVDFLCRN